jgi:hypothetical protein
MQVIRTMQEQLSEDLNAPLVQDLSVIAPCITLVSYIREAISYSQKDSGKLI